MDHDQMVLGWISQHDADWLGMSAAVSGGWVMVMGEWANTAPGFGARVPWGHLLACLPAEGVGVAIEPADGPALASALRDDIGRREASEYCLRTRDRDVIAMRVWLMRIEERQLTQRRSTDPEERHYANHTERTLLALRAERPGKINAATRTVSDAQHGRQD